MRANEVATEVGQQTDDLTALYAIQALTVDALAATDHPVVTAALTRALARLDQLIIPRRFAFDTILRSVQNADDRINAA